MILHQHARRLYRVQIETTPTVTGWELSFDGGETWTAGIAISGVEGGVQALVAGALADVGDAVATISQTVSPQARAVDDPELLIEDLPRIFVTS